MDKDKLKALYFDMCEYAKYLKEMTYQPYDKVEGFCKRLKDIING